MSKKLNLPFVLGIFLIGLFSSNVSQAQFTNVYWDPNGAAAGIGGSGTWTTNGAFWSTNSTSGGGTLQTPGTSTNNIYNFSGSAGTVSQSSASAYTVAGINWLTSGYIWNMTGSRTFTATDNTATGTNTIYITNSANLTLTSSSTTNGVTFEGLSITGGAGSTLTLSNAAGSITTVFLGGTTSTTAGRTNSVNTIIDGAGTMVLGNKASLTGFTQAGNITNNSTGMFVITNNASGSANIAGAISGTGAVTLAYTGSGDISLRGANTYSGNTTIQGGSTNGSVMLYGQNSAFGSGTVTIAGAGTNWVRSMGGSVNITNNIGINSGSIYRLSADNSGWKVTNSGVISGAGSLLLSGTETQILSNTNNSFGGGVTIASSTTVLVNSIGTSGANSSLGTNGTITFSSLSGGGGPGELYWLGSTSENSDKAIALTTVSTNASRGMKIYAGASGSGGTNVTLALNGNINSTGTNNMTITLGAFNTNTLVMNGTINQAAGYTNSLVVGNSGVGTVVLSNTGNSFGGSLTINAGSSSTNTVRVVKIGNAGENSSIGTNGTINIGGGSSSGVNILQYSGSGETNNKVINLAGTTGGATLDQSGTGNLRFSSAITATGVGAKTITLTGSTAGTGELAGAIPNQGANAISLTKSGSGTWILSGSNSYSGNTTIAGAGGLLRLMSVDSLSANTVLVGSGSSSAIATLDLASSGNYVANSYGSSSSSGSSLFFSASSGLATTLTFTNAANFLTRLDNTARFLTNNSANLNVIFNGTFDIGSSGNNDSGIGGVGDFTFNNAIISSGSGTRGLIKGGSGTVILNGTGNNYTGTTAVDAGTLLLTNNATLTGSTALTVSTSGTASSSSSTRTVAATLNVASGSSLLSGSTTTVYSGGNLIMNGTAGNVVVETNGLVGGSGTFNGAVTLKRGSLLNPGNSPGTLRAVSSSWAAGSTYNWEIDDADGTAGTNWDLFSVTGSLDLSALSSSAKMNLVLASLSTVTNFSATTPDSWVFAEAGSLVGAGGVVGAAFTPGANVTDLFDINATAFNGGTGPANGWRVEVGLTGTTLNLMAVPEPSTGSMLGLGLVGLVVTRFLRRKTS